MADVEFQFYGVPNRYQDIVQRMAVLYPFRGQSRNSDDVRRQTQEMLDQWRARIGSLTSAGWEPHLGARSQHSISFVRNCKPTFAISGHRTRCCNLNMLCPFCYARWVREIWMAIDADFPAPDPIPRTVDEEAAGRELRAIMLDEEPEEPVRQFNNVFRFHVVERHHYFTRPVLPLDNQQGITLTQNLTGLLQNIVQGRRQLIEMVDPVGAFVYTTLEPFNNGTEWRIHHRQIFKLTPEQDIPTPLAESTRGRITRYNRPTRRDILQIVARVCRYPKGLITGNPDRTVQLLATRRAIKFHSFARFRSFRQSTDHNE